MRHRTLSLFSVAYIILILLLPVQSLWAFEWPINDPQVVSTFGSLEELSYKKGIEIASSTDIVTPIEGGELIFTDSEYAQGIHDIPVPLGNVVVLQHERGIRSVYGHLASAVGEKVPFFDASAPLGRIGATGIINGEFLFLQIIDSEVNRFVNPLLSLPSISDTTKPEINAVTLRSDDTTYQLGRDAQVSQGEYQLLIDTFDVSSALNSLHRMAPYSLKVYLNGEEQISIGFESLSVNDWTAVPTSPRAVSAAELYSGQRVFRLGELLLQPGEARIEVFVSDFSGNEAAQTYRLQVTSR